MQINRTIPPMPRVVGIDPGTMSFDFFGLDGDDIILDTSIPTKQIASDPESVIGLLKQADPELILGPSGYGIKLKGIAEITPEDLFLMSLVKDGFIPGVIHLPTVPSYRKINRIDMGTPDKLCCCALAIRDQATKRGIDYDQTSFISLEIGFAHTAAIAVDAGKVVDGIGGTSGGIGFLSMGAMDAELAYLLAGFYKEFMTSRGASFLAGGSTGNIMPEDLAMHDDARHALIEGAVKNVLALLSSVTPEEVLLSGRLSGIPQIREELTERLERFSSVRMLKGFPGAVVAKESAQGAALIAEGLLHGTYADIVNVMEIRQSRGTVLDYVPHDVANLSPVARFMT
jgi:predicted butyrate kinase (DUF1464 family)